MLSKRKTEIKSSLKSKLILLNSALASKDSFLPNCKPPPIKYSRPKSSSSKSPFEVNGTQILTPIKEPLPLQSANYIELLNHSLVYSSTISHSAKYIAPISRFDLSSCADGEFVQPKTKRDRSSFSSNLKRRKKSATVDQGSFIRSNFEVPIKVSLSNKSVGNISFTTSKCLPKFHILKYQENARRNTASSFSSSSSKFAVKRVKIPSTSNFDLTPVNI
ncbi:unnamed protein product [Blepharisma stoltei]|uniref:Uncharacterized protein n=1 Tax=Blepharisma stoltei TaxID=1481888 RepID=A0AAU9J5L6_9CILI|nr:unnamed protein product [Blepharisma stoltei]